MLEFQQLVSVNFQGLVVVFGRCTTGTASDVYYNVLGMNVDVNDENLNWSGFSKIEIPNEVRQVGMGIISVQTESSTLVPSAEPFRVVTDQKYISIVQQSTKGTLYVNRFRLLETKSGTDQKTKTYSLSPAWEVRYNRSGKEDVPADKSDTQEYLDPDGKPFLEPSLELSMIDNVKEGAFDVVVLPVSASSAFAWQFFVLDKNTSSVRMYNFPSSSNGLFDVTGKPIGTNYEILPDSVFSVASAASNNPLSIQSAPRATVYIKHEKVVQPDGSSIGVRRAARLMIAIPVMVGQAVNTATIDSAISTKGTIATLNGTIVTSNIVPAPSDLVFDGVSYITLNGPSGAPNPLAIQGAYSISFMIAPAALANNVTIIGDNGSSTPATAAPYVKIVDSDKLEVGFGNGTALVSCRTLHQVMVKDTWAQVLVSYSGVGDNPFTVTINGSAVPLGACSTQAQPAGTAISQIAALSNGFQGALNSIVIQSAATTVLSLPCNTVDYSKPVPETPNTVASGVTALVYGAKLEPSSSPVNEDMSGAFYIDVNGLTYYAGLADFIQPYSSTCLIDGSDGLLHLYFQSQQNQFSVAQFSTESARASFYVGWTTDWNLGNARAAATTVGFQAARHHGWATDDWTHVGPRLLAAPNNTQSGVLNFVANRVGTFMNTTQITLSSSAVSPLLCDIVVDAQGDVGKETWKGLPRDIDQLSLIWNGAGCSNPDDQDVLNQSKPYFDYEGDTPSVLVPSTNQTNGSYFLFTSVPFLPVSLASVSVSAALTDCVQLDIETGGPSNWAAGDVLAQQWPNVPASPKGLRDVLMGKAASYDYSAVKTPGTTAYGIAAATSRSDDQVSYVSLFVKTTLSNFSLTIASGSSSQKCNVLVCGVSLVDVPRTQNEFAAVLNGTSSTYTYPTNYKTTIANQIFALTDGLSAEVLNSAETPEQAGAMAYSALFRSLYIGPGYDQGNIAVTSKTNTAVIQQATFTAKGTTQKLLRSSLFGAVVVSPPTDGGTGRVENTSEYSTGIAPALELGVNGGWMPPPPRFCLNMNAAGKSNYIGFDVSKTFTPSNQLALLNDLTLDVWVNQDLSRNTPNSRVLNYNVVGNFDNPTEPIQYMAGSMRSPGMYTGNSTFVQGAFNFSPPNLTVQIYIKVPDNVSGKVFSVAAVRGGAEFISLNFNQYRKLDVNFLGKNAVLSSANMMPSNTWVCITLTVSDAGSGNVSIAMYINDGAAQTIVQPNTFTDKLGTLTIGSQTSNGLKMTVNGAAFWQRALTATEVQNSYSFGFPDNDAMLGIRWNFAEGAGTTIMNSAATGPDYNSVAINPPNPAWDSNGAFYVPYMARNDYVLASNRILKGWTNMALASQQGRAIKLDGNNFGKVSDADSFNPGGSFALEAWINPSVVNSKQIIVEKPGSYSLYINTIGQVCLDVFVKQDGNLQDDPPIVTKYSIPATIAPNTTSYVAVNYTSGANASDTGSQTYVQQTYFMTIGVYVNGALLNTLNIDNFTKSVSVDNETSDFYLGQSGDNTFRYQGLVSHVRAWSRTLEAAEIAHVYALHLNPENTNGLIAGWNFTEQSGTVANDINQNAAMQLSSNQLWALWQDVAQGAIYVNGMPSIARRLHSTDVDGYGSVAQLTIGGILNGTTLSVPYSGLLEDVRLFSTYLTSQQVHESMNKPLFGNEEQLAAYWKIDAGSGNIIYDMRGMGNNGTLMPNTSPPAWMPSSAPIKNEGQSIHNVLDTDQDYFIAEIQGEPSVIEYAAAEKDAYGNIYSVRKRGYFYFSTVGSTELEVGYKVGDLDTIYLGQVQSQPSVVGYIEGGPPIPSENQTLAYWNGDMGGPAKFYETVSTVNYVESTSKVWSFKANQMSAFTGAFNIKGGLYQKSKTEVSVGIGAESGTQVLENKIKIGAKNTESGDIGSTDAVVQSHTSNVSLSNSLAPAGTWEPANAILNPTVGRRYIQNNVGSAVVKSATADLFMLALKGTQTPVGYTMAPSKNIPVDTNIINFPINPKYIKNGTLDGKVGLANDPDYPNANAERGSYFKPVEAYALKRKIEKEEQQLAAYYDQFEVNKYRVLNSLDNVKDKLKDNTAYNFAAGVNQRSLFNNYVWTAVGGLHKEEHSMANSYTEEYTGASSFKFALGAEINADIGTPFGGYYVEADVMLGGSWSMSASKSSAASNGFSLQCVVTPTGFLSAPKMSTNAEGALQFNGYTTTPAPGKVDGYRYMAFLLAPSKENFTALNNVIDQNWLQNSTSAAAAAMRTAVAADNGTWRILYRTTYVSRVPASFQPVKDDTNAPNVVPPANLPSNDWLVRIISSQIQSPDPTPLEIGTAIDTVLGNKAQVGLLKDLLSWWTDFYTAAQVYGSTEFIELAELRVDLLNYMEDMYESEKYLTT